MKWALFSSLITLCLSSFAPLLAEDIYADNRKVMEEVRDLTLKKDWLALENLAQSYRESKEETPGGNSKLNLFYNALDLKYIVKKTKQDISDEKVWLNHSDSISAWEKQHPDSITTPVLRISYLTQYAWKARGSGFAHTVTKDGWQLFRKRLKQAEFIYNDIILKAKGEVYPCPEFYHNMLSVSLGQGWDKEEAFQTLITPVIENYPYYHPTFHKFDTQLMPKWGGSFEARYAFLKRLRSLLPKAYANQTYARIITSLFLTAFHDYKPELVDWEIMKLGIKDFVRTHPKSTWRLEEFIKFSVRHNDQPEVLSMLENQNPQLLKKFYQSSEYGKGLRFASKFTSHTLEKIDYFRPRGSDSGDRINSISAHPHESKFVASCRKEGAQIFNYSSRKNHLIDDNDGYTIQTVEYSPCGKYLLVIPRYTKPKGFQGVPLWVYEVHGDKYKRVREIMYEGGHFMNDASFINDSQTIILYNEAHKSEGFKPLSEVLLWEWKQQDSAPIRKYKGKKNWGLKHLTLSNDKTNAYLGGEQFLQFDLSDTDKPPVVLLSQADLKRGLKKGWYISRYALTKDESKAILLIYARKHKNLLLVLDLKTKKILLERVMDDLPHTTSRIRRLPHSDTFILGSVKGFLSTWELKTEEIDLSFKQTGAWASDGDTTTALEVVNGHDGHHYLLQGTILGKLAVYRINE